MAVMIEPRKEDETDPVADLGNRVSVLEVKLDGLSTKVDEGFEQVDKRFERVEGELREQRKEMKAGFDRLDDRFVRMQWYLMGAAITLIVTLIGAPHL
jgi:hypothetical protein